MCQCICVCVCVCVNECKMSGAGWHYVLTVGPVRIWLDQMLSVSQEFGKVQQYDILYALLYQFKKI